MVHLCNRLNVSCLFSWRKSRKERHWTLIDTNRRCRGRLSEDEEMKQKKTSLFLLFLPCLLLHSKVLVFFFFGIFLSFLLIHLFVLKTTCNLKVTQIKVHKPFLYLVSVLVKFMHLEPIRNRLKFWLNWSLTLKEKKCEWQTKYLVFKC